MADSTAIRRLDLDTLEIEQIFSLPSGKVAANIKCVFLEMKPSNQLGVYYFSGGWIRSFSQPLKFQQQQKTFQFGNFGVGRKARQSISIQCGRETERGFLVVNTLKF